MHRLMAFSVVVAGISLIGCGGAEVNPEAADPPPPGQDLPDTDIEMDQSGANAALPPDQQVEEQK